MTGQVYAYCIDLGETADLPRHAALLDPGERERAGRYRHARDRRRFILRRAALRAILGRHLGTPPERLRFAVNRYGKPALPGIGFNLAASQDWALCVVASGDIGCDIEQRDAFAALAPDLAPYLAPAEAAHLAGLAGAARMDALLECWTRKEAIAKAIGLGVALPFERVAVPPAGEDPARLRLDGADWTIRSFDAAPGYRAAIAVAGPALAIALADWPGGAGG